VAAGPLAGTGSFTGDRFTRRSCCLYYQAPRSGLCGDCVLVTSQPADAG
jgi:ferric iron reductase protein FhuF